MRILRGYKTELSLNNTQRTACLKACGVARFAYNWGLRIKIDEYQKTGKSPNAIELHRRLNTLKKTEFPWMYEVSKCAPQEALRDLDRAFQHFFRRVKNGEKPGFPKFKSKKKGIGSFRLTGHIRVEHNRIKLPRLGWLRLKETGYLPTNAKILSATVSERAGRWFVSIQVQEERDPLTPSGSACGVDVGIISLATLDNGTTFDNPKALLTLERKLRRLQQAVSRKKPGSKNRKKAVQKLRRLHYRIHCVRKDAIHKATTEITSQYSLIGIESLHVAGMVKNHTLAKSIVDASFSEFHRQLEYKTVWKNGRVVKAAQWFPSSKRCSGCGNVKTDLALAERTYYCPQCGLRMDRDQNAAINLRQFAVSSTVTACGEER